MQCPEHHPVLLIKNIDAFLVTMSIASDVKKWYNNMTVFYHMKGNIMKRILTLSIVLSLLISVFTACDVLVAPETPTDSADTDSTVTEALVCSEGLAYASNGDGTCAVVGIGSCTDTDVVIPKTYNGENVTGIGDGAFKYCTGLTSIVIPDSVTNIGESVFVNCTGLTSIKIPDGVTSIGTMTFFRCSSLASITIPDGVTSIGVAAFFECIGLTSITIPDGVTGISNEAFYGCTGLTSITIPDSVTSIGGDAFYGCSSLTSIVIPDSMTGIGNGAFFGCSGLTSIVIPDSVTSIGDVTFRACTGLTSITFEGTMEQWNAVTKGFKWNEDVPATEVICSDGTVPLN